jgi:capsular exopolysaccharide synthesis family protein
MSVFISASIPTYAGLVTKPIVLTPVLSDLELNETPDSLAQRIRTTTVTGQALISIVVTDTNRFTAARIANAVAASLVEVVTDSSTPPASNVAGAATPVSPVRLIVVQEAEAPVDSSGPGSSFFVILGLIVGLALGVAAALIWARVGRGIRSEDDLVRASALPVIGRIPRVKLLGSRPLVVDPMSSAPVVEAFRSLRTVILTTPSEGRGLHVVTSPSAGDARPTTATAVNLAAALAESGLQVLLVDANLRGVGSPLPLGAKNVSGLSEVLLGTAPIERAIQTTDVPGLSLVAAGAASQRASSRLGSETARELLADLATRFDAVVFDTAPLLEVADSAALASLADDVILVVSTAAGRRSTVEDALELLDQVDAEVIGTVLSRLSIQDGGEPAAEPSTATVLDLDAVPAKAPARR